MMRVAVLASGGGTNLQALLDTCQGSAPARVVVAISNKATAGALERARKAGVAAEVLDDPSDGEKIIGLLRSYDTELVVLAGYLKLVPEVVVQAYENRMLNIHPALLPSFGGPGMYGHHVHEAVLASGATVSGPTVHIVTAEYDRGPIVAQWPVPVGADDTPDTLAARVLEVEHQLLPAVVLAAARAGQVVRLVGSEAAYAGDATPGSVADTTAPARRSIDQ
jgi:formyltetrahydrofolate-dependent phosphoribosylglycinamide formyltransferase